MDKNTYSPAALKALVEVRKKVVFEDAKISEGRSTDPRNEVYGAVSLISEHKLIEPFNRQIFDYPELGIRINVEESDCKLTECNRSCRPNIKFMHYMGRSTLISLFPISTRPIDRGEEMLMPFNKDWEYSETPLVCKLHQDEICPMEERRRKCYNLCKVFTSMGPENLARFAGSVQTLFTEMAAVGKMDGKIVVSGSDIEYAVGTNEFQKYESNMPSTSKAAIQNGDDDSVESENKENQHNAPSTSSRNVPSKPNKGKNKKSNRKFR